MGWKNFERPCSVMTLIQGRILFLAKSWGVACGEASENALGNGFCAFPVGFDPESHCRVGNAFQNVFMSIVVTTMGVSVAKSPLSWQQWASGDSEAISRDAGANIEPNPTLRGRARPPIGVRLSATLEHGFKALRKRYSILSLFVLVVVIALNQKPFD